MENFGQPGKDPIKLLRYMPTRPPLPDDKFEFTV